MSDWEFSQSDPSFYQPGNMKAQRGSRASKGASKGKQTHCSMSVASPCALLPFQHHQKAYQSWPLTYAQQGTNLFFFFFGGLIIIEHLLSKYGPNKTKEKLALKKKA